MDLPEPQQHKEEPMVSGILTESGLVPDYPLVVSQISEDDYETSFRSNTILHESIAVDVLAIQDTNDDTESSGVEPMSDDDVLMYDPEARLEREEPSILVIPADDDELETADSMDTQAEQPSDEYEVGVLQEEQPRELYDDELQQTELYEQGKAHLQSENEEYADEEEQKGENTQYAYVEEQSQQLEENEAPVYEEQQTQSGHHSDEEHLTEQQHDEQPQEYLDEQPQEYLDEELQQEEQPQEYLEVELQQEEQPQEYLEVELQQEEQPQEYLEVELQQEEQPQEYLEAELQQEEQPQEYWQEQLQKVELTKAFGDEQLQHDEQPQEYLENDLQQVEQPQEYGEDEQQYEPNESSVEQYQYSLEECVTDQRQDPPEEYLADYEQDEQLEYSEMDDNYSDVFPGGAAITRHLVSQDSGDDDDSEAFRRGLQDEEAQVVIEFERMQSSNEMDAVSNAERSNANNSIFANSYSNIREQLDTSHLTEQKSTTPESYDNVVGSDVDDFDEFLDGGEMHDEVKSTKPDNFFPYPTKIIIPHVGPLSQAPTKDSTSSPPPSPSPKPFLTPRRINILVALLCFVLVASVGVAVGSFLAQQAGKSTPQSSAVNSNENSTTVAPTSFPTTSPTELLDWSKEDCVDHPYKKFSISTEIGDQDCVYLQNNPAQRDRLCLPDNEGYLWCPVTCGLCDENLPTNAPGPAPPVAAPVVPPTERPSAATPEPTSTATVEPSAPLVDTLAPTRGTISPTASPTVAATTLTPTPMADDVRSAIMDALTSSTVNLDDMNTSAGRAFDWVSRSSSDLPSWRISQQFALAGLAYSAGVGSWLGNTEECSWNGVTCNSGGQVTGLELREAGLQGNLFPELYMLSDSLMTLNAGQNNMNGPIPDEIGLLRQLQILQLDRNDLSGRIPAGLGKLNNLLVLNLEENSLTGPLPARMENMQLLHFRFYSNDLTGSIFDSWCIRGIKLEADCNEIDCPCCSACY
jgi:topoisomerase-4 subunit A